VVSDVWPALKRSYAEVRKLYDDLYPAAFARREWTGKVYARKTLGRDVEVTATLGRDVEVTAWTLAEHFLLGWSDWDGLRGRYLAYFGQPDDSFPRTWHKLATQCSSLAERLLSDRTLDVLVAESWFNQHAVGRLLGQAADSPRAICHILIANHERLALLSGVGPASDIASKEWERPHPQGPVWPETLNLVRQLNGGLSHDWDELSRDLREASLWHLRHYQRATLLASWLADDVGRAAGQAHSALWHALTREIPVVPSIDQFVAQANLEPRDREIVDRVLRRVQAAVADFGYDNFAEDVLGDDFLGGDDSPVGSGAINLVPGERKGACCTTLLAVSKGVKGGVGFPSIMKQVREHLIRCMNKTRVVIILCDHWSPGILNDHLGDLRAHHDRGVRFLFLMAGTPDRIVAPVGVDLGLTP
jgi:hypothetical protein